MTGGRLQRRRPNGSRLSCGASARRRKRPVLRHLRAGAPTYASPESRPRQLQALVQQRPRTTSGRLLNNAKLAVSLGPHEVRLPVHPDEDDQHLRWHRPVVLRVGPGVDHHEERITSLVAVNHAAVHIDFDRSLKYVD
jgi:hypothetical protein